MNKWIIKIINYNCIVVVEHGNIALFGANQDKTLKLVEETLRSVTSESANDFSEAFLLTLAAKNLSARVSEIWS